MEKLFTSLWFPSLLALLTVVLAIYILCRGVQMIRIAKACQRNLTGTDFIYHLLYAKYPVGTLFKNLQLIEENSMFVIGKSGSLVKRTADIVYVGRGGVLLLTVIQDTGCYDNPKTGNWKHSVSVNGQAVTKNIVNPFDATNPQISSVENLLAAEEITQQIIERVVVFTGRNVMYTTVYKEILSPGTLLDFVKEFNRKHRLSPAEVRKVCAAFQTLRSPVASHTGTFSPETAQEQKKLRASRNLPHSE